MWYPYIHTIPYPIDSECFENNRFRPYCNCCGRGARSARKGVRRDDTLCKTVKCCLGACWLLDEWNLAKTQGLGIPWKLAALFFSFLPAFCWWVQSAGPVRFNVYVAPPVFDWICLHASTTRKEGGRGRTAKKKGCQKNRWEKVEKGLTPYGSVRTNNYKRLRLKEHFLG